MTRSLPAHDVADLALARRGAARIEWAERSMPVLRQIRERFASERPFEGVRVAACMHVTTETANLVRALVAGGARVALCASNPLSTQDDVAAALVVDDAVSVFARAGTDTEGYYAHIHAALDSGPDLVFDDGCDLVSTLHSSRTELLAGVKGGCEQTATGVLRLRAMARAGALRFPVVALNDTATKHLVDNRYGTGQSTMDAVLRATNMLVAGQTVVVAGYGACGAGVASRARGLGANVIVTEVNPTMALAATMEGYRVLPMAEAARQGDVFVTVTGNRGVLRGEHFAVMKDGAVICNSGHFDVEVDVRWLADHAVTRRRVRPHVEEFGLADGRRLLLLAEGRVVNLAAAEGHPAAVMDMAFSDEVLCAQWLLGAYDRLEPGVHDVPAEIDQRVASLKLASMGVRIDALSAEQERYLDSWEFGS
jgi:adenosylhomocysteinase